MSQPEIHYAILDFVKKRLNIADTDESLDDYLEVFMQDVDNWVNNELRKKLGTYDYNGRFITLPLTTTTVPPLEPELMTKASMLVIGRVRQEQSNDNNLLQTAENNFATYLNRQFGFTRDVPFKPIPTLTITPVNGAHSTTVVTVSGTQFGPNRIITISFGGTTMVTSPAQIITDSLGSFSAVTFTVPNVGTGPYAVIATDSSTGSYIVNGSMVSNTNLSQNSQQAFFLVTS